MADSKISALPASTTPLAGTEVLPIVQSSATKQVTVANLTAGRTQTSNGIVQGTAATGYNFTANTPTAVSGAAMTSQLLNWYEEGTWTPTITGTWTNVGTPTLTGTYTRIGRQVTLFAKIAPATSIRATAGLSTLRGLPFAPVTGGVSGGNQADDNALGYVSPALAIGTGGTIYVQTTAVLTYALYVSVTYFV